MTEQTHNSIHKALITLGFGTCSFGMVNVKADYSMDCQHLRELISQDRKDRKTPVCVVGTLGSTSCTALDPADEISAVCEKENLWFHIDAAHGGSAAILESVRKKYRGWENADSILVNPHKWLFMPIDLSVLYIKAPGYLKNAFHYSAEYLKTAQDDMIDSYMDYGIPLGRRFRCLKLWFSLKCLGVEFFKNKIRGHLKMSDMVYDFFETHPDFEIMAPKPLSTTCFRALPAGGADMDAYNEKLMDAVNRTGQFFVSHTKLNGHFVLRHVVSGIKTDKRHIVAFIETIVHLKKALDKAGNGG